MSDPNLRKPDPDPLAEKREDIDREMREERLEGEYWSRQREGDPCADDGEGLDDE